MDYAMLPRHQILCVDMKSFYASCSAVMKGLDPLNCYLAVVGDKERPGSVVLAASPRMKSEFGIKTGARLFEIPKDDRIILEEPKMATYLRISTEITRLFHRYVPKEAIHTYSVDESFLKIDGTTGLWGDAQYIAEKIKDDIEREFQLPCAIGIGPNMLLAKLCLDLEDKKKVHVIAQNQESSTVYGMPKSIVNAGLSDQIVPLDEIAQEIILNVGVK